MMGDRPTARRPWRWPLVGVLLLAGIGSVTQPTSLTAQESGAKAADSAAADTTAKAGGKVAGKAAAAAKEPSAAALQQVCRAWRDVRWSYMGGLSSRARALARKAEARKAGTDTTVGGTPPAGAAPEAAADSFDITDISVNGGPPRTIHCKPSR